MERFITSSPHLQFKLWLNGIYSNANDIRRSFWENRHVVFIESQQMSIRIIHFFDSRAYSDNSPDPSRNLFLGLVCEDDMSSCLLTSPTIVWPNGVSIFPGSWRPPRWCRRTWQSPSSLHQHLIWNTTSLQSKNEGGRLGIISGLTIPFERLIQGPHKGSPACLSLLTQY
jgi:hypothetical protein